MKRIIIELGDDLTVLGAKLIEDVPDNYGKLFDDSCRGWTKDLDFNITFLKHQECYANDLLRDKGHLFLNEVYDMLGMKRTKAGQVVGWIYDERKALEFECFPQSNGNVLVVFLAMDGYILDRI